MKMKSLVFALVMVLATACHFTVTKNVSFKESAKNVLENIKSKYAFENVTATQSAFGGSSDKSLITLKLVNGKNLPSQDGLENLGGHIASDLVDALEDPTSYKSIKVSFVSQQGSSVASTATTIGYEYELK
jgi:hypothetical protein